MSDMISHQIEASTPELYSGESENTKRSYSTGFDVFKKWCEDNGAEYLPAKPKTVRAYVASLRESGLSMRTIENRAQAISWRHQKDGFETPTAASCVQTYLDKLDEILPDPDSKRLVTLDDLQQMRFDSTVKGIRDRALMYFGWTAGLGREDVESLKKSDLLTTKEGCVVVLTERRDLSEHQIGRYVPRNYFDLPADPVFALEEWLYLNRKNEPVFTSVDHWGNVRGRRLTGESYYTMVKEYMEQVGRLPNRYGASSMRFGGMRPEMQRLHIERELDQVINGRPFTPKGQKQLAANIKHRLEI